MTWPDCSPPSESPRASIASITYLSPTDVPHDVDTGIPQRDLEADVAHHGRHDGIAGKASFALHLTRAHQQHRVAVHDVAALVDEDRAIAVAVKRDAHLALLLQHHLLQRLRMRGTAVQVDVAAVWLMRR